MRCKLSIRLMLAVCFAARTIMAFRSPTPLEISSHSIKKPFLGRKSPTALSVLFQPGDEDKDYPSSLPKCTKKASDGLGDSYYSPLVEPLEITCDPDFPCVDEGDLGGGSWLERYGENLGVYGIPGVTPFISFFSFDHVAAAFHGMADILSSNKNWVSVDGGAYQARIIAPAINGVVIPAVALLLATLTSTTITTLRQRQLDVRRAINLEASEIRALECLLDSITAGSVQDQCRDYLLQYTCRILDECHPRLGEGSDVVNPRRGFDSELNGLIQQLNKAHGTVIPAHLAAECYSCLGRLREQRSIRITALQSVYPVLHYLILGALTLAICTAFLIETDQELLVFLNAFQLKILWSMLTGTFVACFAVFADLRAPFSGSYRVSDSVDQLHTIKWTLQASRVMSAQKKEQVEKKRYEQEATKPSKDVAPSVNGASKPVAEENGRKTASSSTAAATSDISGSRDRWTKHNATSFE